MVLWMAWCSMPVRRIVERLGNGNSQNEMTNGSCCNLTERHGSYEWKGFLLLPRMNQFCKLID